MKTLFSTLALTAALTSAALAEPAIPTGTAPVVLTDAQMDQVTAGGGAAGGVVNDAVRSITAGGGNDFSHGNDRTIDPTGANLGAGGTNPVED
jgi:hypothetical protein